MLKLGHSNNNVHKTIILNGPLEVNNVSVWCVSCPITLLAKKLCDSSFLGNNLDLINSHFNMYGSWAYLLLYIIKWYVGWCGVCFGVNH